MLRAVAQLLNVAEDVLLDAGSYSDAASSGVLPPRSRALPLGSLTPDRFEDLIADVLQLLHPDGHVSRFGGPGEKQFGIDILVAAADAHNLATAQCKRHLQFGEAAVSSAVRAVTIEADRHYLFLSRETASPGARREIGRHPGWQLWDGEDTSRYIRSLPLDRAVRIVDTYFPGHREAFLSVASPSAWLPPEDYFAQSRGQLVSHEWHLVGRYNLLEQLKASLYASTGTTVVLVGRGGTGKTRLLRAVAEACPDQDTQIVVLPAGVAVEPAGFELLSGERRLVVLIDDAHDRDDLNYLLSGIWRRNADARILIATRPYRWDAIRSDLRRNPLAPDDPVTLELADLSSSEAEDLAREALGDSAPDAVVHRLARLTRDCPLVTVVGGVLISRGNLDPTQLSHDDQVRDAILRGFRDAIVSDPLAVDPDTRSAVLDAVAALQPFRVDDDTFRQALSALIGKPFDVLNRHLRNLEDAGILRRRGPSLRIMPDLLGDVVLTDAYYDEQTKLPTGYLDRVRTVADGQVLRHLFVNVNRVDWQVQQRHTTDMSLVESLWGPLEAEMRGAGILGRRQLVGLLARVAYFQPGRIVALARWLIDNPIDDADESHSAWGHLMTPTYQDVLNELPPMLKAAAYTFNELPEVLNLLWELAQHDDRPANQHPDHPMRVLRDLTEYEIGKPLAYNDAVVDIASKWFASPSPVSPFDVLEPLLETEGSRQTYQEYALTFQPYPLNMDAVSPIRERVIKLALEEMQVPDVRRAVRGVQCIESALHYPHGMYGRSISDEERERWTPGFVYTIKQLGAVAATYDLDPVVLVAIRKALNWHTTYSKTATQPAAEGVLESLREDLPGRLALIVHDGWGHLLYDREYDYAKVQEKIRRRLDDAVSGLGAMTDEAAVQIIRERLANERLAFGADSGNPAPLVSELIKARPTLAPRFIDLITNSKDSVLEPLLPVVLATHAEIDPEAALARLRDLLATQDSTIARGVAQSLGWNRGRRPLTEHESQLLLEFAVNPDPVVRQAPIVVAGRLAEEDPALASQLVTAVDFSDNPRLADEVFMCFSKPFGLKWEMLTPAQVAVLRARLVALADIDQHSITTLLAERSAVEPDWLISLLQDRVTHAEGLGTSDDYMPLPFRWGNRLLVRQHPDFPTHLRRLHAWIAAAPDSPIRRDDGAEIFHEVARPYDEAVIAVLEDALKSTTRADITAVAAVLCKAHRTFIWEYPDFVQTALRASATFGQDSREAMAAALWRATISGVRTGTPGKPYAEDLEQRDRSQALAGQMRQGSYEEQFYRDMAASADASIRRTMERDRPDDGRDW